MSRIATFATTTAAAAVLMAVTLGGHAQLSAQAPPTQSAPPAQTTPPPQTTPPTQTTPPRTNPPQTGSQTAKPTGQSDMNQMGDREEDFLKDVAQGSQVEIESSTLAATKAQNAEVKAFAQKLVDDHTKAGKELDALVKNKHADWPPDDPKFKEKKQKHESLQTLTGAEFDKEYLEDMISDHEATIARFARYSLNAKDAQIKAFAEKMQPELREHLKMARDLKAKLFK